jgi:hypothetical protein
MLSSPIERHSSWKKTDTTSWRWAPSTKRRSSRSSRSLPPRTANCPNAPAQATTRGWFGFPRSVEQMDFTQAVLSTGAERMKSLTYIAGARGHRPPPRPCDRAFAANTRRRRPPYVHGRILRTWSGLSTRQDLSDLAHRARTRKSRTSPTSTKRHCLANGSSAEVYDGTRRACSLTEQLEHS